MVITCALEVGQYIDRLAAGNLASGHSVILPVLADLATSDSQVNWKYTAVTMFTPAPAVAWVAK